MGGHHSTSRRSGLHARNSTRRRFGLAVGRRSVDQDRLEGLASSRELDHVNDQPSSPLKNVEPMSHLDHAVRRNGAWPSEDDVTSSSRT